MAKKQEYVVDTAEQAPGKKRRKAAGPEEQGASLEQIKAWEKTRDRAFAARLPVLASMRREQDPVKMGVLAAQNARYLTEAAHAEGKILTARYG